MEPLRCAECHSSEDLLEHLLRIAGRSDSRRISATLIDRFGSVGAAVCCADQLSRMDDFDDSVVDILQTVHEVSAQAVRATIDGRPILGAWDKVVEYCRVRLAYLRVEQMQVLFLNSKNVLITDEPHQRGTVNHTPVYAREIMRRALELDATAIVMCHNHPSGNPTPSRDDVAITRDVIRAADALSIVVHDHIVVGRSSHASLRSLGLMD